MHCTTLIYYEMYFNCHWFCIDFDVFCTFWWTFSIFYKNFTIGIVRPLTQFLVFFSYILFRIWVELKSQLTCCSPLFMFKPSFGDECYLRAGSNFVLFWTESKPYIDFLFYSVNASLMRHWWKEVFSKTSLPDSEEKYSFHCFFSCCCIWDHIVISQGETTSLSLKVA